MKTKLLFCFFCLYISYSNAQDSVPTTSIRELPILWHQTSSEYRALCYQAFNIATRIVNEVPKRKIRKGKLAIITDIDETILDNSRYVAQLALDNKEYTPALWKYWVSKSSASAVPGAVEFLQYAKQKGITIFYVSNRDTADIEYTLIDLKRLQFPDADRTHCLFVSNTSSKEIRRQAIMNNYEVLMLLGDNLNDFTNAFEKKTIDQRYSATDKLKDEWGKKFIVLPNVTYGDWEDALYDYQHKLTIEQKDSVRRQLLIGY